MDGKHFSMSEYNPGVTAPPLHPNCRSVTVPYNVAIEKLIGDSGERAARDEDGNTVYVPGDITYKDWYKQFVEGEKQHIQDMGSFEDSLKNWQPVNYKNKGDVKILNQIKIGDLILKVDGKAVVFEENQNGKRIAELLANKYGKTVCRLPRVNYPQGISTSDYLIDERKFDLKTVSSAGKNVLYNALHGKKAQADNYIFDVSESALKVENIEQQIANIYKSKHMNHVNEIIVISNTNTH